jgi:hypothetical protein
MALKMARVYFSEDVHAHIPQYTPPSKRPQRRLKKKKNMAIKITFLSAFAKFRKSILSFAMFDRPSARKNPAPTGRIFIKFGI